MEGCFRRENTDERGRQKDRSGRDVDLRNPTSEFACERFAAELALFQTGAILPPFGHRMPATATRSTFKGASVC